MPISTQDWLHRPTDDSLTLAGVAYACRSFSRLITPKDAPPSIQRLRRIVSDVSAELSFRRWLDAEDLPYQLHEDQPFTRPERPSVIIGGRRAEISAWYLASRQLIHRFLHNPNFILQANVNHPTLNLTRKPSTEGDLIVFALHLGHETQTNMNLASLEAMGLPSFIIAIPKKNAWRHPRHNASLGKIRIEIRAPDDQLELEIACRLLNGRLSRLNLSLAEEINSLKQEIASLFYVHPSRLPSTAIELYSSTLNQIWFIRPDTWRNLWIYTEKIIFLGWTTQRAFCGYSQAIHSVNQIELSRRRLSQYRAIQYRDLRPMRELIQRIHQG